jgi:hypothetical protein
MKTYRFKFSQLPGDLINFLPGIKHVCERDNAKAEIWLGLDMQWGDERVAEGRVTLTEDTMRMLKPLLMSQYYISGVFSWKDVDPERYKLWIDFFKILRTQEEKMEWHHKHFNDIVDLDKIYMGFVNMPYGNIHRWPWYFYPDMACDLSKPWLDVAPDETFEDCIVINRTLRSRNQFINYEFLKNKGAVMFVGLHDEYVDFVDSNGFAYGWLYWAKPDDFLQLAAIIRSAKLFIGNQSLCFALAEAMKVPRILETCPSLPNVIPCGGKAYDFYYQSCLEYYFNELNK